MVRLKKPKHLGQCAKYRGISLRTRYFIHKRQFNVWYSLTKAEIKDIVQQIKNKNKF